MSDPCEKLRKEVVCRIPFAHDDFAHLLVVVKLFNTIQQSQLATAAAEQEAKASRGTGKPLPSTPSLGRKDKGTKSRHETEMMSRVAKQST